MRRVCLRDSVYVFDGTHLTIDDVRVDLDRIFRDPSYLPLCALGWYLGRFIPCMDEGTYHIYTYQTLALNLVTGIYTESDDFSLLFSFRHQLRLIGLDPDRQFLRTPLPKPTEEVREIC